MTYENIRLRGFFTTLSPLSHIGESVSTTSYLVQDPVVQPDGAVAEVFSYSGNAWRGQLRDLMARRVARAIGRPLPADSFHLLFSGGRLDGAEKKVDLAAARGIRAAVPMLALLGGGIGSEILQGRLRVFNSYPVCREAIPVLPSGLRDRAERTRYGGLVFEKEFSRKDDARGVGHREFLAEDEAPKDKKAKGVPDQMRMTSELLAAGTDLYTEIHGAWVSRVELGCLVAALHDFGASPCIGGQGNKGHGLVDLRYDLQADATRDDGFVAVTRDGARLSGLAAEVMGEYLAHLDTTVERVREVLKCAA